MPEDGPVSGSWISSISIGGTARSPLGGITETAIQRQEATTPRAGFRRFGAYAFVYLLAGSGTYMDELGACRDIDAGDLILVFPDIGHVYGPKPGSTWVERFVVFEGSVFDLWRSQAIIDERAPVLRLPEIDRWNREIDHILGGSGRIGTIPPLEAVCRLQLFLARASEHGENGSPLTSDDRAWLDRARALLDRAGSGDDERDLQIIADDLMMTYEGFRKRFRRLGSISPARYRSQRTIDRACEMMHERTMSDREIAEALGFCDEHYFSRRFRQIMGRSPRAYRQTLLANRN